MAESSWQSGAACIVGLDRVNQRSTQTHKAESRADRREVGVYDRRGELVKCQYSTTQCQCYVIIKYRTQLFPAHQSDVRVRVIGG